jgi:hypothetical protein
MPTTPPTPTEPPTSYTPTTPPPAEPPIEHPQTPYYPIIAEHQKGGIWGDPHVLNPDDHVAKNMGEKTFDSHDAGSFNILSDKNVQLDADFIKRRGTVTEVGDVRLALGDAVMTIEDKYNVHLNGQKLEHDGEYMIDDQNKIIKAGKKYDVQTPEYNMTFDVIDGFDDQTFLGMWVHTGKEGVYNDGVMPTGMLGDLFDADDVIEHDWKQPLDAYRLNDSVENYIDRQSYGNTRRFF